MIVFFYVLIKNTNRVLSKQKLTITLLKQTEMEFSLKLVLALLPLVIINLTLIIWCLFDWLKREKFKLLPKIAWLFIFLFIQFIGPLFYLFYGRNNDSNTV